MILKSILTLILLFITISSSLQFKDCNFTDYRFQSQYNLGKQDQLNNTFDAMKDKINVPDVIYPVNSYTNFSLTSIKSSFFYADSKQKAQVMGNDTIVIDGGYLQTTLDMKWARKDFMQRGGSLQAVCKSQQIIFAKNLSIQQGFLVYEVLDYFNITFQPSQCKIVRYQPATTSQQDLQIILQLLSRREDNKQTVRSQLENEINKKYLFYLNDSLYNQRHHIDDSFIYQWVDEVKGKKLQIQYQILPTGVDIQKQGLSFTFVTEIKDYDKWECGSSIPHENLDVNKYGGIQQFLSLSVFKNTLKYGIQAGALDTVLNNINWKSRMFQFYAGDLYQVIPYISQKYLASQEITGTCKGVPNDVSIVPQQKINQLVVKTSHICQLYISNKTKIMQLHVDLFSEIEARFQEQAKVNFYFKAFTHSLSYLQQAPFKIDNYDLANEMVLNSLRRLLQGKTFGSGWPTYKMDYPHLKVMAGGYVVFYDTSHIGQIKSQTL